MSRRPSSSSRSAPSPREEELYSDDDNNGESSVEEEMDEEVPPKTKGKGKQKLSLQKSDGRKKSSPSSSSSSPNNKKPNKANKDKGDKGDQMKHPTKGKGNQEQTSAKGRGDKGQSLIGAKKAEESQIKGIARVSQKLHPSLDNDQKPSPQKQPQQPQQSQQPQQQEQDHPPLGPSHPPSSQFSQKPTPSLAHVHSEPETLTSSFFSQVQDPYELPSVRFRDQRDQSPSPTSAHSDHELTQAQRNVNAVRRSRGLPPLIFGHPNPDQPPIKRKNNRALDRYHNAQVISPEQRQGVVLGSLGAPNSDSQNPYTNPTIAFHTQAGSYEDTYSMNGGVTRTSQSVPSLSSMTMNKDMFVANPFDIPLFKNERTWRAARAFPKDKQREFFQSQYTQTIYKLAQCDTQGCTYSHQQQLMSAAVSLEFALENNNSLQRCRMNFPFDDLVDKSCIVPFQRILDTTWPDYYSKVHNTVAQALGYHQRNVIEYDNHFHDEGDRGHTYKARDEYNNNGDIQSQHDQYSRQQQQQQQHRSYMDSFDDYQHQLEQNDGFFTQRASHNSDLSNVDMLDRDNNILNEVESPPQQTPKGSQPTFSNPLHFDPEKSVQIERFVLEKKQLENESKLTELLERQMQLLTLQQQHLSQLQKFQSDQAVLQQVTAQHQLAAQSKSILNDTSVLHLSSSPPPPSLASPPALVNTHITIQQECQPQEYHADPSLARGNRPEESLDRIHWKDFNTPLGNHPNIPYQSELQRLEHEIKPNLIQAPEATPLEEILVYNRLVDNGIRGYGPNGEILPEPLPINTPKYEIKREHIVQHAMRHGIEPLVMNERIQLLMPDADDLSGYLQQSLLQKALRDGKELIGDGVGIKIVDPGYYSQLESQGVETPVEEFDGDFRMAALQGKKRLSRIEMMLAEQEEHQRVAHALENAQLSLQQDLKQHLASLQQTRIDEELLRSAILQQEININSTTQSLLNTPPQSYSPPELQAVTSTPSISTTTLIITNDAITNASTPTITTTLTPSTAPVPFFTIDNAQTIYSPAAANGPSTPMSNETTPPCLSQSESGENCQNRPHASTSPSPVDGHSDPLQPLPLHHDHLQVDEVDRTKRKSNGKVKESGIKDKRKGLSKGPDGVQKNPQPPKKHPTPTSHKSLIDKSEPKRPLKITKGAPVSIDLEPTQQIKPFKNNLEKKSPKITSTAKPKRPPPLITPVIALDEDDEDDGDDGDDDEDDEDDDDDEGDEDQLREVYPPAWWDPFGWITGGSQTDNNDDDDDEDDFYHDEDGEFDENEDNQPVELEETKIEITPPKAKKTLKELKRNKSSPHQQSSHSSPPDHYHIESGVDFPIESSQSFGPIGGPKKRKGEKIIDSDHDPNTVPSISEPPLIVSETLSPVPIISPAELDSNLETTKVLTKRDKRMRKTVETHFEDDERIEHSTPVQQPSPPQTAQSLPSGNSKKVEGALYGDQVISKPLSVFPEQPQVDWILEQGGESEDEDAYVSSFQPQSTFNWWNPLSWMSSDSYQDSDTDLDHPDGEYFDEDDQEGDLQPPYVDFIPSPLTTTLITEEIEPETTNQQNNEHKQSFPSSSEPIETDTPFHTLDTFTNIKAADVQSIKVKKSKKVKDHGNRKQTATEAIVQETSPISPTSTLNEQSLDRSTSSLDDIDHPHDELPTNDDESEDEDFWYKEQHEDVCWYDSLSYTALYIGSFIGLSQSPYDSHVLEYDEDGFDEDDAVLMMDEEDEGVDEIDLVPVNTLDGISVIALDTADDSSVITRHDNSNGDMSSIQNNILALIENPIPLESTSERELLPLSSQSQPPRISKSRAQKIALLDAIAHDALSISSPTRESFPNAILPPQDRSSPYPDQDSQIFQGDWEEDEDSCTVVVEDSYSSLSSWLNPISWLYSSPTPVGGVPPHDDEYDEDGDRSSNDEDAEPSIRTINGYHVDENNDNENDHNSNTVKRDNDICLQSSLQLHSDSKDENHDVVTKGEKTGKKPKRKKIPEFHLAQQSPFDSHLFASMEPQNKDPELLVPQEGNEDKREEIILSGCDVDDVFYDEDHHPDDSLTPIQSPSWYHPSYWWPHSAHNITTTTAYYNTDNEVHIHVDELDETEQDQSNPEDNLIAPLHSPSHQVNPNEEVLVDSTFNLHLYDDSGSHEADEEDSPCHRKKRNRQKKKEKKQRIKLLEQIDQSEYPQVAPADELSVYNDSTPLFVSHNDFEAHNKAINSLYTPNNSDDDAGVSHLLQAHHEQFDEDEDDLVLDHHQLLVASSTEHDDVTSEEQDEDHQGEEKSTSSWWNPFSSPNPTFENHSDMPRQDTSTLEYHDTDKDYIEDDLYYQDEDDDGEYERS